MERKLDSEYFEENVLESKFEEDIRTDIKSRGMVVIKMPCSLEKGMVLPDLLCIIPRSESNEFARIFFIEVKTPNGRLQKIQEITFRYLNKFVDVHVVKNWEQYYKVIDHVQEVL